MSPVDGIMSTVFGSHAEVKVGSTAEAVEPRPPRPAVRKPVVTVARSGRHPPCVPGRVRAPGQARGAWPSRG